MWYIYIYIIMYRCIYICISGWWFGTFFTFSIYWEKSSQLTNIFQRGWNHQPDDIEVSGANPRNPRRMSQLRKPRLEPQAAQAPRWAVGLHWSWPWWGRRPCAFHGFGGFFWVQVLCKLWNIWHREKKHETTDGKWTVNLWPGPSNILMFRRSLENRENHGTQIAGGRWEDHPATRDAVMQ